MNRQLGPLLSTTGPVRLANRPDAAESLTFGDLSDFFNPFLHHFAREALRSGREVWIAKQGSVVDGLFLYNDIEKFASVFTRSRPIAETLFALKEHVEVFSEFALAPNPEIYHVYAVDLPGWNASHQFTHRPKIATATEQPSIERLMKEMYGHIDTGWLQPFPRDEETCLVVRVGAEIAGVGWVSVVNGHGRLHSLTVRPGYRRAGIGTDLWHARMIWALRAGAHRVISEISEHNGPSLAIATAGGMNRIGQMFLSRRP